jgi:uncharacterized protein (DUF697 family)
MKSPIDTIRNWAAAAQDSALAVSLMQAFDWAYGKAVDGVPGFAGAEALAAEHAARHPTVEDAVDAVIAAHARLAGLTGFATGCGGFVALPVAFPANLAGTLYLQTRLVAVIAHLHGHDIRTPRVRMLVLACLSGSRAADTLRDAGVRFGTRLGRDAAAWAAPLLLNKSRHAGHIAALSLAGSRGFAGLSRLVPLLGGVVAGGFDAALTHMIGRTAHRLFAQRPTDGGDGEPEPLVVLAPPAASARV